MLFLILGSLLMGTSLAFLSVPGWSLYLQFLEYIESDLRLHLKKLRSNPAQLRMFLHLWVFSLMFIALIFVFYLEMPIIGISLSVIFLGLPWYLLRQMTIRRKEQIEAQLADAMISLSSSIQAGLSLTQSLGILAEQSPSPICQEFQQIIGEYHLGKPLDQCLSEAKEKLNSENFSLFTAAIEASRTSGGRLNETVERIAQSVREYQRLERKITAETSQARTSAIYMAITPVAMLLLHYFVIDPINTARLFTTVPGQLFLITAVFLDIVAYLWAKAILSPNI